MMDLGIKAPTILMKIDFVNPISMTNLRTIMKNIENGNLELDGDYPVPTNQLDDINTEIRLSNLEERMNELENKSDCDSIVDKVKLWIRK